ncbi:MAG: 50S ribosomal protein L32 [Dehalococcoidia bacterium]|jgi:large subunit ribosomal protein L32|nr:50S ribosomal protein L32 [Chloroflexota bacterium]MCK4242523.1 50S ribosomal protein L32 [Dehalococcoidia bacterium]
MAVPKRKTSKARKRERRSHMALSLPAIDYCPQCHSPKLAHHVCPTCGSYRGREVMKVKAEREKG